MVHVTVKELLDVGVHYGHQTSKWNPKMQPYIFGERNGIYIIDLQKTAALANNALEFTRNIAARGGEILFVGTKRQAQDVIREEAHRCNMHYVNVRWLGGTLTNFKTIKQSIDRLRKLEKMRDDKTTLDRLPKKEIGLIVKELDKLDRAFCGIKNMKGLPSLIFVIDPLKEKIAVHEGNILGIPVLGLIDTNGDPDDIDYIIPGNDDAIKSIKLFAGKIADACLEGMEIAQKSGLAKNSSKDGETRANNASVETLSKQMEQLEVEA